MSAIGPQEQSDGRGVAPGSLVASSDLSRSAIASVLSCTVRRIGSQGHLSQILDRQPLFDY